MQKILQKIENKIEHIFLQDFNLHHFLQKRTKVEVKKNAKKLIIIIKKA